jgi:hypothetical protein
MTQRAQRKLYWQFTFNSCTPEVDKLVNDPKILESVVYLAYWKESGRMEGIVRVKSVSSHQAMQHIFECTHWTPICTTLRDHEIYSTRKLAGLLTEIGESPIRGFKKRKKATMEEHEGVEYEKYEQLQGTVDHLETQLAVSKQESDNLKTQLATLKQESDDLKTQVAASKQESDNLKAQLKTSEEHPGVIVTDILDRMRNSFMARINNVQHRFAHIASTLKVIYLIQPPFRGDLHPVIMSHDTITIAAAIKTARLQHHPDKCAQGPLARIISTEITKFLNCIQEEFARRPDGINR